MNQPYIKQFDEFGNVSNPIIGKLENPFPNRRQRRTYKQTISSTKIARCSMNNNRVVRKNKYVPQPENNYCK